MPTIPQKGKEVGNTAKPSKIMNRAPAPIMNISDTKAVNALTKKGEAQIR